MSEPTPLYLSCVKKEELIKALTWSIDNDETNDTEDNLYWIIGLERQRRILAFIEKREYEPLEWGPYFKVEDLDNRKEG